MVSEDVKSLALPGTYHEKITSLATSLKKFTRLKNLDLSRNSLESLKVARQFLFDVIMLKVCCSRAII